MPNNRRKLETINDENIAKIIHTPAKLYTIFLPLNHNDGRSMQSERLEWAEQKILHYAGGLTKFPPCEGLWMDRSGNTYRDLVIPILTVIEPRPDTERWFARLLIDFEAELEQHQIFLLAQPLFLVSLSITERVEAGQDCGTSADLTQIAEPILGDQE